MLYQTAFLAALITLTLAASLPVEEKIEPIDMAYGCVGVTTQDNAKNQGKSPVVLIHGVTQSKKSWIPLQLLLSYRTGRRVCAVDLRNHGDSAWNNLTDVPALSVDLDHFLDKQGIKKVNLIGHSLGGQTAIYYALSNPDRVDSLIVEDMRPNGITQEALFLVTTFIKLMRVALDVIPEGATEDQAKKAIVEFLNKKLEEAGSSERLDEKASDFIELKSVNGKFRYKFNIDILEESVQNPDKILSKGVGLYEGPTLFIYGSESPFKVAEDKENILKLFPKAKLVPVKGAGHIIHGSFKEFDDEVIKFFNQLHQP